MVQRASGTYRDGRIELDEPVDWEEGMRVTIKSEADDWGIDDPDAPMTPEEIKKAVAAFDAIEPLDLTPEELAEIDRARKISKEQNIEALKREWGL